MKENLQENGWEGLYYVSWLSLKNIKITSYISYFYTFNVSVHHGLTKYQRKPGKVSIQDALSPSLWG